MDKPTACRPPGHAPVPARRTRAGSGKDMRSTATTDSKPSTEHWVTSGFRSGCQVQRRRVSIRRSHVAQAFLGPNRVFIFGLSFRQSTMAPRPTGAGPPPSRRIAMLATPLPGQGFPPASKRTAGTAGRAHFVVPSVCSGASCRCAAGPLACSFRPRIGQPRRGHAAAKQVGTCFHPIVMYLISFIRFLSRYRGDPMKHVSRCFTSTPRRH